MRISEVPNIAARRPTLTLIVSLLISAAPLFVLAIPVVLQLPAVEPLLHESAFYPGFSRASLVAVPLAGLVLVNLAVLAANRSMRPLLVAALITSGVAWLLVAGAVGLVNDLNEFFGGVD